MRQIVRTLAVLLAGVCLVATGPAVTADASARVRYTSTVTQRDFEAYCRRHGYTHAVLVENTAYGWECRSAGGGLTGIDVSRICVENNPSVVHVLAWQRQNAYLSPRTAWSCRALTHEAMVSNQPHGYLGDVSVRRYCQSRGYDSGDLRGTTVNDWFCTTDDQRRPQARVDLYTACRWQYEGGGRRSTSDVAVPVFDYDDPYSTTCWR
jgi:hypothetical protein